LVVLVAVVAVLVPARPAGADNAVCQPPGCIDVSVPVPAGLVVPENRVRVLLPDGYDDGCIRYPVLYLLHGVGDTYRTWTENTDVEDFARQFPVIVVMPDGGKSPDSGWYSDWVDGSRQWETFHIDVMIDYVDRTFRTLGDGHRLVAGLSMGGFGAMSYAGRHPGRFHAAASFSGAVDMMLGFPLSGPGFAAAHPQFGTPDDRVWGNQVEDEDEWRAHNPTDLVAALAGTELFVASGTGTPGGPAGDDLENPGGYAVEAAIFQMNLSFTRALTLAGVPFHQDLYAGGLHDWPYWERELHWALPQMAPLVGPASGSCDAVAAGPGAGGGVLGSRDTRGGARLPATGAGFGLGPGVAVLIALTLRRLRPAA
jgi:S-formylglutathione hydrolase FrmB